MNSIIPINYNIHLEPDSDTFRFSGRVDITLKAQQAVDHFCLNILELAIWKCELIQNGKPAICDFTVTPKNQEMTVTFPESVSGEFVVSIDYMGEINNKMAGFYRSAYQAGGAEKFMFLTQFQESDARRAIPCVDHPAFKATFDLEMIIDESLTAISNCPVKEENPVLNGKKRVLFEQTPHMSTYLLFFGVGEFEFVQDPGDVLVQVACMPGQRDYTSFGLSFGRKSLTYCEQYYDIPFPLPKVDLIAIADFAFGAMENWGAITFRENLLLHYPGITSKSGEESITSVIAHEMAHQWFGNLVTPSDWKYLWLNESFATYFGYGVVDHYYPEWDMWDRFMEGQTKTAMERDAMHQTFPIELPGGRHVAINASTATIIYNKGGSILRCIKGYIGDEAFKEGLRKYLKKFSYACATSRDLWESLEETSGKPVTRMMKSWIEQPGYPMIEVQKEGRDLVMTQKRFTCLSKDWDQKWSIPVTVHFYYKNGEVRQKLVLMEDARTTIPVEEDSVSYKINGDQTGFFRVKYSLRQDLLNLGEQVATKSISPRDRWGLQNDMYAFVKSGDVSIEDYLDFLSFYKKDDAFLPLVSIAGNLHHAHLVFEGKRREAVAEFGKTLMERILEKIGYEPQADEPPTLSLLRDQVLVRAGAFGSESAHFFAAEKFKSMVKGRAVHPDITRSVMLISAMTGDPITLDWFTSKFLSSESEHERMNILTALGFFEDTSLIQPIRDFVLKKVPDRNRFVPITAMAANPAVSGLLWDWFVNDIKVFETFHPMLFERVITGIVPIGGIGREETVRSFFDEYLKKHKTSEDVALMAMELMEINAQMKSS